VTAADRLASRLVLLLTAATATVAPGAGAQTIHAVLFHSPTCPHCRQVITEDLPLFFEVYGGAPQVTRGGRELTLVSNGKLTILFADASEPAGGALYDASFQSHPVGADRRGVPRMIVGDSVMVGSYEIPARLHAIVRAGLAGDGIPWPDIPGLADVTARLAHPGVLAPPVSQAPPPQDSVRANETPPPPVTARPVTPGDGAPRRVTEPDTAERTADPEVGAAAAVPAAASAESVVTPTAASALETLRRDPVGNGLAVFGLGIMVLTLGAVGAGLPARVGPRNPRLWLPVLAVIGAGVAAYLTYIETSGATAVCGPVGDCNTVQQSEHAQIFGVPVGLLGLVGYGVVIVLWVLGQEGRPIASLARRSLVAATLLGTLFSVYLTVLEPFVIGATCMWCLSSAALMTGMLWLAAAWKSG
jgi:uncharacterized membrane protein